MGDLLQKVARTLIFSDNACEAIAENWSTRFEESDLISKKEMAWDNTRKVFAPTAEFVS